jgi:rhamnulokinase
MGAEVDQPCLTAEALNYNFTNEGGVFDTWRLSKNIMGLWLVQECKRMWERRGEVLSYDEITHRASEARPFLAVIDPDDHRFLHPGDMAARIQDYCRETNQTPPQTKGEVIRVVLESIALKYRWVLERLEDLTRKRLAPIHIIGGGIKNRLLNQFTAEATGREVVTGPVEATAIGNLLMQAVGLGQLSSLSEAREVVRASFEVEEYHPTSSYGWDDAFAKLLRLLESNKLEK